MFWLQDSAAVFRPRENNYKNAYNLNMMPVSIAVRRKEIIIDFTYTKKKIEQLKFKTKIKVTIVPMCSQFE